MGGSNNRQVPLTKPGWRLSTKLKCDRCKIFRCRLHHDLADGGTAREEDVVEGFGQKRLRGFDPAFKHTDEIGRKRFGDHAFDQRRRCWCHF